MPNQPDATKLKLFETELWTISLNPNQSYLGRSVASLKRKVADPLFCTPQEHDELWESALPRWSKAVADAFSPARFNYGHMANRTKQVHWHLVPRYEPATKDFAGVTFIDEPVGHSYVARRPQPKDFSNETLDAIRQEVLKHLGAG
jgi:diadenosine tetraphosphate (Ap4A) HIT family hydrolase